MNSKFTKLIRNALGITLIVFGANMFLHFLPVDQYVNPLNNASYIFPIVGFLEVIIGVLMLLKKWIAFSLIILAPISINIVLFHLFLGVPGISIALLVTFFNATFIFKHWPQYKPLFY